MIIHVNSTDVRPHFSELMGKVEHGGQKLVITRYGYPVAAVVSMTDFDRMEQQRLEEEFGPPGGRGRALTTVSDVLKKMWA